MQNIDLYVFQDILEDMKSVVIPISGVVKGNYLKVESNIIKYIENLYVDFDVFYCGTQMDSSVDNSIVYCN